MATITAAILCDFAQVRENLLFVSSGGLTRFHHPGLPALIEAMLAIVVDVPASEQEQAHELIVVFKKNDTAEDLVRIVSALQRTSAATYPGESIYVPAVIGIRGMPIPAFGSYDVRISVDGEKGPDLTFYVVQSPEDLT